MLKAMKLKFQKSHEVNVGICDMQVFVRKYLCQEKKFGISLGQWRHLPERWTGILFGIGFVEAAALHYLGYEETFCLNRLLAAATAASVVRVEPKEGKKPLKKDAEEPLEEPETGLVLEKEEERIFQEVLSDFLGTST